MTKERTFSDPLLCLSLFCRYYRTQQAASTQRGRGRTAGWRVARRTFSAAGAGRHLERTPLSLRRPLDLASLVQVVPLCAVVTAFKVPFLGCVVRHIRLD